MSANTLPAALRDIAELRAKTAAFRGGRLDEERFKHFRLTRGVYGQRQLGVHMFRTKIPAGRLTGAQLAALADASERFTNGRLHLTTRQNVQLHYVKLDDAAALSERLAVAGITARGACGNTVRNVTASARAGVDPDEAFDVTPYVHATFEHFLRNPVSQAMGRKVKIAFSATDADSAFTYFHDFGLVPRVRTAPDGRRERGFRVMVAGGLGAQPLPAQLVTEFMPEQHVLPFVEAAIRVFDRYGERAKRMKARMKFLVKRIGLAEFLRLVDLERAGLAEQEVWVDRAAVDAPDSRVVGLGALPVDPTDPAYAAWRATNVFAQAQRGRYGVAVRVPLGNLDADTARAVAALATRGLVADDLRITVNQGLLLRHVRAEALPHVYAALDALGLAAPGADSTADVTACPGTDTCNLGVTNSTALALELERVIRREYPDLVHDASLKIKLSGCMNACGQHMAAAIGMHGSSIKRGALVIPAMQIVLGGGVDAAGEGLLAERVIKLPTRRAPAALRLLLDDFAAHATDGEYYGAYFRRRGKPHFYALLKPLADLAEAAADDLTRDWGEDGAYVQAIGVGECAGVAYDLVGAIVDDQREHLASARAALADGHPADAVYHAYTAFVTGAKALLLSAEVRCNTQDRILADFDEYYVATGRVEVPGAFREHVLRLREVVPTEAFANTYLADAETFLARVVAERERQLAAAQAALDAPVVKEYYHA